MAEPVPAGSDVSAGTYECTNCGKRIDVGSTKHLPPCPSCNGGEWQTITGGDAADDPYPGRDKSDSSSSAVDWVKEKTGMSQD